MILKCILRVANSLSIMSLVGIFMLSVLFQGCEKDEFDSVIVDSNNYLSIAGDINNPGILILPENREIYELAVERVLSVASQRGNTVSFFINSGLDINISERLFLRISSNLQNQIESGKMMIVKEEGKNKFVRKVILSPTMRLKYGNVEPDDDRDPLDGNVGQAIMHGMSVYNSNIHNNINDIWNLSSGNFQAHNYYQMSGGFTYGGSHFRYSIANGCGNGGEYDCDLNDINSFYTYQESGGKYYFVIDNIQQLPSVTISTYSKEGFTKMSEYLGLIP